MKRLAIVMFIACLAFVAMGLDDESTSTTRQPTICDQICPSPGPAEPELYPVPSNCSEFCVCERYFATLKECQNETHFNPELGVCDWPWNAGCDPNATPPSLL